MVYFRSDNIISPLGITTKENFTSMANDKVGIRTIDDPEIYPEKLTASMIDENSLEQEFNKIAVSYSKHSSYTKLEKMLILSIHDTLGNTDIDITSPKTGIILSTTKGNIDLLANKNKISVDPDRVLLWKLGDEIQNFFGNPNKVVVISNACISGVLAINTAAMNINAGLFDNMVVTGGDLVTRFVASGFMSFLALSPNACKPFDVNRDGLSLGEAAGTIILSRNKISNQSNLIFKGSASANDANHISGPSRDGEGSYIAIKKAMGQADLQPEQIDHISAHGTATSYNDEMESVSIDRHNLLKAPVNSIKSYLGHTLGAAGIVETAILLEEMRQSTLLKSAGFEKLGVSRPIKVIDKLTNHEVNNSLKLASGFGGCNAALIISKV